MRKALTIGLVTIILGLAFIPTMIHASDDFYVTHTGYLVYIDTLVYCLCDDVHDDYTCTMVQPKDYQYGNPCEDGLLGLKGYLSHDNDWVYLRATVDEERGTFEADEDGLSIIQFPVDEVLYAIEEYCGP
jgi:hypothetical protein